MEDLGYVKKIRPACYAFVGMLQGINSPWKQPFFYNPVHTQCEFCDIKKIVIDCLRAAKKIELEIVAIVSDMGSNFMQLADSLGVTAKNSSFTVDGVNYFYIFDVPHLLTATRNNFTSNHLLID